MVTYFEAVRSLVKQGLSGPTDGPISDYKFDENTKKPTEAQIQAKLKELEDEYEKQAYARSRAKAYPSWQTQMDLLYHGGLDALKSELKKTKDKFPKP